MRLFPLDINPVFPGLGELLLLLLLLLLLFIIITSIQHMKQVKNTSHTKTGYLNLEKQIYELKKNHKCIQNKLYLKQ